jgi:hypothetical protein
MKHASITTKMSWAEIEGIIDREIAEANNCACLSEEDIAEIRLNTYLTYGWDEDPFPESLHEEADEEDEDDEPSWHSLSKSQRMSQRMSQVGTSWAGFF